MSDQLIRWSERDPLQPVRCGAWYVPGV